MSKTKYLKLFIQIESSTRSAAFFASGSLVPVLELLVITDCYLKIHLLLRLFTIF